MCIRDRAGAGVGHRLPYGGGAHREAGDAVDDVHDEAIAVEVVADDHVERRGRGAGLLVAAHVQVRVAGAAVGEAVDQPRIAVVREDHRLVGGEQAVVLEVAHPVRMLFARHQAGHVDDVHHADRQLRQVAAQQQGGGQDLLGGHVAGAGEDDVRFAAVLRAGPVPDAGPACAVGAGGVHGQPVEAGLLAGHDHVDVVAAAQGVVGDGEEGVGVRRQIDPYDFGALVEDVVDEAGVLVGEAVVVLAPDV